VAKTTEKKEIKVAVDIRPGPVTPHQREAWRHFWQKLIAEVKAGER
jgi:hypothetical protein